MARIRTIKPEFWSDPVIAKLTPMTRLFFVALWNFADDAGRARALARELAGFAFPYDDDVDAKTVNAMLSDLADAGRILLYEAGDMRYYQIVNWKHQVINKPTVSRVPPPEGFSDTHTYNVKEECSSTTGRLPEECSSFQGTEDGRRKTEDGTGSRKLENGNGTTEGGPGETAPPQPTEPASVPSVRPSFGAGSDSVRSDAPVSAVTAPSPPERPPGWQLTEADRKSLMKDGWRLDWIEIAIDLGIQDGTEPRKLRSLLHNSLLPRVRDGDRPEKTANAPPARSPVETSDEEIAAIETARAERWARIRANEPQREAERAKQGHVSAN